MQVRDATVTTGPGDWTLTEEVCTFTTGYIAHCILNIVARSNPAS